jgi:hypothetical protein
MGDWLGTGNIATFLKKYRSFREARAFAHKLKLRGQSEWFAFCKGEMPRLGRLPSDIPATPASIYANKGWVNWGHWLGTRTIATFLREYRSFREARAFVHKLKLKSSTEWCAFYKGEMTHLGRLPENIPAGPWRTYADKGWKGMGDWLGTGRIADRLKVYRPFREARAFARKLKLKNNSEWVAFCKGEMPDKGRLPVDIPANAYQTYADKGWKGMGDWLGIGRTRQIRSESK